MDQLLKTKERIQKLKETEDSRYINKMSQTRLVFNMIWLMEILKIYQDGHSR